MSTPFPLGRHPEAAANHDPRSLNFPAPTDIAPVSKWWRHYGPVLDQGQVGSCTGNAAAQALNTKPFHVVGSACLKEPDAVALYTLATQLDSYPGSYPDQDTGSDGLSVAKAAQQKGYITGYQHSFGLDHLLSALQFGPSIVGTVWTNDMFYPDAEGFVKPTGGDAGGHEYLCSGVNMKYRFLRFLNSWSPLWGKHGHFFITFDDFSTLLGQGGDAVLFVN